MKKYIIVTITLAILVSIVVYLSMNKINLDENIYTEVGNDDLDFILNDWVNSVKDQTGIHHTRLDENNVLVVISVGVYDWNLYSINISSIDRENETITINYELITTEGNKLDTPNITTLYKIIKILAPSDKEWTITGHQLSNNNILPENTMQPQVGPIIAYSNKIEDGVIFLHDDYNEEFKIQLTNGVELNNYPSMYIAVYQIEEKVLIIEDLRPAVMLNTLAYIDSINNNIATIYLRNNKLQVLLDDSVIQVVKDKVGKQAAIVLGINEENNFYISQVID